MYFPTFFFPFLFVLSPLFKPYGAEIKPHLFAVPFFSSFRQRSWMRDFPHASKRHFLFFLKVASFFLWRERTSSFFSYGSTTFFSYRGLLKLFLSLFSQLSDYLVFLSRLVSFFSCPVIEIPRTFFSLSSFDLSTGHPFFFPCATIGRAAPCFLPFLFSSFVVVRHCSFFFYGFLFLPSSPSPQRPMTVFPSSVFSEEVYIIIRPF